MEAVFVTERIILLSAGEEVSDGIYRQAIKVISLQLQRDYTPQHYLILNVSEPRSDLIRLNANVMDYGWATNVAPPLERLCAICKQADVFLNAHPRNTLIIHCKGGLGRAALVVASYMHYTSICAVSSQALDRYAMKHFFDEHLRRHIPPSQRRYVQYFSGLLDGSIAIRNEPVFLNRITLVQVPNFDGRAGCRPCFKIYQAMEHIWTSEVYSLSESEGRRVLSIHLQPALQLRGDIMIKCHHHKKLRPDLKDTIFRCQIHTCAIQEGTISFNKCDLDEADNDIRFPHDGRLELVFCRASDATNGQEADSRTELYDNPLKRPSHSPYLGEHLSLSSGEQRGEALSVWPDLVPSSDRRGYPAYKDLSDASSLFSPHRPAVLLAHQTGQDLSTPFHEPISSALQTIQPVSLPQSSGSDTYAKVKRKVVEHPVGGRQEAEGDLDSGLMAWREAILTGRMVIPSPRRSQSPGGTLKSVKFRDLPETKESLELEEAAASLERMTPSSDHPRPPPAQALTNGYHLRSGQKVLDLDAMQPDFDELDRAFESLQSENESVDGGARPVAASHSTRPRDNDVSSGARSSRRRESQTGAPSPTAPSPLPESSLISGYVPQDRKGLAKKFGAFTFGLPTSKPELKPVDHSPDAHRRRASGDAIYASDYETSQDEAMHNARDRLKPVSQHKDASRRQAEQVLYNSTADDDTATKSPYGVITSVGAGGRSAIKQRSLSREVPLMSPSPTVPRPRTPTEEQRLQRLLKPEEKEFVMVEDDRRQYRYHSPLKVIAKEETTYQSPAKMDVRVQEREAYDDARMEAESGMSEGEEWPLPERKKKKQGQGSKTAHPAINADYWLEKQHHKLLHRKYGSEYEHRQHKEQAMLQELRHTHQRMQEQVPNRDADENRLPLSSIVLREAKTPPLTSRHSGHWSDDDGSSGQPWKENPGYARVRSQLTPSNFQGPNHPLEAQPVKEEQRQWTSSPGGRRQAFGVTPLDVEAVSGHGVLRTAKSIDHHPVRQPLPRQVFINQPVSPPAVKDDVERDTDHDSIVDEVDFSDEPLYKAPLPTSRSPQQPSSRSRQFNESNSRGMASGDMSGLASPDLLRKSAASPKSILKNASLTRVHRNAVSEERPPSDTQNARHPSAVRPETPNFPPADQEGHSGATSVNLGGQHVGERRQHSTARPVADHSGRSTPTGYFGMSNSRRASLQSLNVEGNEAEEKKGHEVLTEHPLFVRDVSKYWYKPAISREEAIQILKSKVAGSFLIRDSHSFPGAFGLAVKVDAHHLPPNNTGNVPDNAEELVRHFLIESSAKGVHLKGSPNEPIFASLPALVYQHSLTPLALPCRLTLPHNDLTLADQPVYSEDSLQRLMEQGAACNVFYLLSLDTESLTGPQAIRRAMTHIHHGHATHPTVVHFKVNDQGVLLTDNQRKLFFRRNYPIQSISFCGMDPDDRRWSFQPDENAPPISARCFGFVTRKPGSANQNECLIFAELEAQQPAGAVVSFVTKVIRTANSSGDGASATSGTFRSRPSGNYAGLMRSHSYRR